MITTYLIGCGVVFIGVIIALYFLRYNKDINIGDLVVGVLLVVLSWISFVIIIVAVLVAFSDFVIIKKKDKPKS